MSSVRFDLDACNELLRAQQRAADELHEAIPTLSDLATQAYRLLGYAPHPNYTPTAGLHDAAIGLRDDHRDLEWRVEFIRRMDGEGLVGVSEMPDWTWEQAQAWYLATDIEALAENRKNSTSLAEAERKQERLEDMVAEYIGTDDPGAVAAVIAGLNNGESLTAAVQGAGVRMQEAAYVETINQVALARDLSFDDAEDLWEELQPQIAELVEQGYSPAEATDAAFLAEEYDLDIDEVADFAAAENIGLSEALVAHARADHYGATITELNAYDGLNEHFPTFDNAKGGDPDGKVSLDDLQHVVDNPDQFSVLEVAAAAALLASPGLLSRLDTGKDNNDILNDGDRFGDENFDDRKISREDLENFEWKQGINALVGTHFDDIDVVNGGEQDQFLSKADFETYLQLHRGDLSDDEIEAFQVVIDGDLHDQTWLERNKHSIALTAAVIAGAAIVIGTGGLGTGVSGVLITTVAAGGAGAAAAGTTTFGINMATSEDWHDDLAANTASGFLAGAGSGGAAQVFVGPAATTFTGKAVTALGLTSDATGLTAMGTFDWGLEHAPGIGGDNLDNTKGIAGDVSLVTGLSGVGVGLGRVGIEAAQRGAQRAAPRLAGDAVNSVSTIRPQGVNRIEAEAFLRSSDGEQLITNLRHADPNAGRDEIWERALQQVESGVALPETIRVSEPLVKITPVGEGVSPYSPYWTSVSDMRQALDEGVDLAEHFGLPLRSHSGSYEISIIRPLTDVPNGPVALESTIAPTRELGGLVTTDGGGRQIIVSNRNHFTPAETIEDGFEGLSSVVDRSQPPVWNDHTVPPGIFAPGVSELSTVGER